MVDGVLPEYEQSWVYFLQFRQDLDLWEMLAEVEVRSVNNYKNPDQTP